MLTHKYIDRICCVILAFTLILTVIMMNTEAFSIKSASKTMGYETRLFDTSRVHTLDIVMDDWDGFLESCTNEEYVTCAVVIDGEAYKNVAIRAKGNTSLSNVKNYGNNRYSFKIEFDHYDSTKTYHGLDKLSLNNIIQDNTYVKDYLCYQMMGYFGVNAPLCSFVQININGEEWGLYLAVEGVEDSFTQRNYSSNCGILYKPDSQSMGGGRGNGGKFNMDDFDFGEGMPDKAAAEGGAETGGDAESTQTRPEGQRPDDNSFGQRGEGFTVSVEDIKASLEKADDETLEQVAEALGYADTSEMLASLEKSETSEEFLNGKDIKTIAQFFMPQGDEQKGGGADFGAEDFGGHGGDKGGAMGSDDVKLVYTDDEYSSYSNIFENAKSDITDADKDRLIASLKSLNENTDIENVVDTEEVIRYFVVHNFVCNFDSYTGSMIHNYYLYEENGKLSMIPWDYNLAFGGFVGGSNATSLVNYPIDSPVSGSTTDSRPMLAWIFDSEEYTELYHQYFAEFTAEYFDSGYFSQMIDSLKEMLSEYVESDPTKFCTYEEFEKGIDTLKEFCLLRAESVNGQLNSSIPSTSDGQSQDKTSLIDASSLNISDMGSMNGGMGGQTNGNMPQPDNENQSQNTAPPDMPENETGDNTVQSGDNNTFGEPPENSQGGGGFVPNGQMPDNMPQGDNSQNNGGMPPEIPSGMPEDGAGNNNAQSGAGNAFGGPPENGQGGGGFAPNGQMPDNTP